MLSASCFLPLLHIKQFPSVLFFNSLCLSYLYVCTSYYLPYFCPFTSICPSYHYRCPLMIATEERTLGVSCITIMAHWVFSELYSNWSSVCLKRPFINKDVWINCKCILLLFWNYCRKCKQTCVKVFKAYYFCDLRLVFGVFTSYGTWVKALKFTFEFLIISPFMLPCVAIQFVSLWFFFRVECKVYTLELHSLSEVQQLSKQLMKITSVETCDAPVMGKVI